MYGGPQLDIDIHLAIHSGGVEVWRHVISSNHLQVIVDTIFWLLLSSFPSSLAGLDLLNPKQATRS